LNESSISLYWNARNGEAQLLPEGLADEGQRHRQDLRDAIDEVVKQEAADKNQELNALLQGMEQLKLLLEACDVRQPLLVVLAEQNAEFISQRTHI